MSSFKRKHRAGATETFSVSVDARTKRRLKALAALDHGGNVSALITALSIEGDRRAAFERAWRWYGGTRPTEEVARAIRVEWEEGWKLARQERRRPTRKAAA